MNHAKSSFRRTPESSAFVQQFLDPGFRREDGMLVMFFVKLNRSYLLIGLAMMIEMILRLGKRFTADAAQV